MLHGRQEPIPPTDRWQTQRGRVCTRAVVQWPSGPVLHRGACSTEGCQQARRSIRCRRLAGIWKKEYRTQRTAAYIQWRSANCDQLRREASQCSHLVTHSGGVITYRTRTVTLYTIRSGGLQSSRVCCRLFPAARPGLTFLGRRIILDK